MIKLINNDIANCNGCFDMIFTDPPFEMPGIELHKKLENFQFDHLLLIASMHQIIDFCRHTDLQLSFDLVISHITPKKSRNYSQPNYLHSNIVYLKKQGVKSAFDRRLIKRYDHYSDKKTNYFPSIFHAPKKDLDYKYQKNQYMINDLVGSFNVNTICDPFAGSGTTGLACLEHDKLATLIEKDKLVFDMMMKKIKLLGVRYECS